MSDELARDVQLLWQARPREEQPVSIDDFRAHVHRFDRNMRLLYLVNVVAFFVLLIGDPVRSDRGYGDIVFYVADEFLWHIGWGLTVAALCYVGYHGRAYQQWLSAPATLGLAAGADSSGLPAQPRGDISSRPWRYLAAYVPGFGLIALGLTVNLTRAAGVGMAVLGVALFVGVAWSTPERRESFTRKSTL